MPTPTVVFDTVDGAELDIGYETTSVVRTGVAYNIPAQAIADPFVLCRALTEMGGPQIGEAHPWFPNQILYRIVARPGRGTNDAVIQYHYDGPGQARQIITIEDDTTLAVESEETDPTGAVIQTTADLPGAGPNNKTLKISKTATAQVLRPRRCLRVSALMFGNDAPSAWSRACIGTVNDSNWPTGSLWAGDVPYPRGYWLCTMVSAAVQDKYRSQVFEQKKRPYRVSAQFQSKVRTDWGHLFVYRDRYGNVPRGLITAAKLKALRQSPYEVGQQTINGAVKSGQYELENFAGRFGF